MRFAVLSILLSTTVLAQTTTTPALTRFPYLSAHPNVDPSVATTYRGAGYYDSTLDCFRHTSDGQVFQPCQATMAEVELARDEAESVAAAALASAQSTLNASIAAVDSKADANASAISTTNSSLTSAVSTLNSGISSVRSDFEDADDALDARVDALESGSATQTALDAVEARVDALESSRATTAALNAAVASLEAEIDAVPRSACANASVSGLSIPLTGISSTTTVSIPGAPVGTSCRVGIPAFTPLGAKPVTAVLSAGQASLRFEGNSGLLSGIIAIPSGTYRICCDL